MKKQRLREVNLTFLVTQLDNSRTGTWSHGPNVAQTLLGIGEEDNECAGIGGRAEPRPKPIVCVGGSHLLSTRHSVGGHVENTVHPFEGTVQGFCTADISLKQQKDTEVGGLGPR